MVSLSIRKKGKTLTLLAFLLVCTLILLLRLAGTPWRRRNRS